MTLFSLYKLKNGQKNFSSQIMRPVSKFIFKLGSCRKKSGHPCNIVYIYCPYPLRCCLQEQKLFSNPDNFFVHYIQWITKREKNILFSSIFVNYAKKPKSGKGFLEGQCIVVVVVVVFVVGVVVVFVVGVVGVAVNFVCFVKSPKFFCRS